MIDISEDEVKRLARILGATSSASFALTNAERLRASGVAVRFFRAQGYVGVTKVEMPPHAECKGGDNADQA